MPEFEEWRKEHEELHRVLQKNLDHALSQLDVIERRAMAINAGIERIVWLLAGALVTGLVNVGIQYIGRH